MDRNAIWYLGFQWAKVILLSLFVIYLYLLPLNLTPAQIYPPNFVLLMAIALIVRHHSFLPVWLVMVVFLLYDFLLYQPLGLTTFLALIGLEYLRGIRLSVASMPFAAEWLTVSAFLALFMIGREVALFVILADRTPLLGVLGELSFTIIYYPLAVLVISIVFPNRTPIEKAFEA